MDSAISNFLHTYTLIPGCYTSFHCLQTHPICAKILCVVYISLLGYDILFQDVDIGELSCEYFKIYDFEQN